MPTYKTKQTYDLTNNNDTYNYGRFTKITNAREQARVVTSTDHPTAIFKNPKILPNGQVRPRFKFIECRVIMFIRPTYDYKMFCKEAILKNDMPTGKFKYYLVAKDGSIAQTDSSFSWYFNPNFKSSGVWTRPKRK